GDAEVLAIIDKQVTEFCLTEAARVGQNSLKDGLKIAWRTGDRAEHLGGRRLLLQRLGKVPPHLGELTGARFELLFQLAQRIGRVANARFRLRSGRTKLAGVRWTSCNFVRQNHLVGTVTGPPLRPSPACGPPKSPILPVLCRTHRGLLDARAEFEPGILVLLQCGALRRPALPGMQSCEHDPKRLQGPRYEMQHKRQRHFAFVLRRWLTWFYPQVCQNQALSGRQFAPSMSATASQIADVTYLGC